jgi:hypothetical protein
LEFILYKYLPRNGSLYPEEYDTEVSSNFSVCGIKITRMEVYEWMEK